MNDKTIIEFAFICYEELARRVLSTYAFNWLHSSNQFQSHPKVAEITVRNSKVLLDSGRTSLSPQENKRTLCLQDAFLATVCREIFADWPFFCVLRELIFAIRIDWLFSMGINFSVRFSQSQYPVLIIFSFLLSTCNADIYFQTIRRCAYPI